MPNYHSWVYYFIIFVVCANLYMPLLLYSVHFLQLKPMPRLMTCGLCNAAYNMLLTIIFLFSRTYSMPAWQKIRSCKANWHKYPVRTYHHLMGAAMAVPLILLQTNL